MSPYNTTKYIVLCMRSVLNIFCDSKICHITDFFLLSHGIYSEGIRESPYFLSKTECALSSRAYLSGFLVLPRWLSAGCSQLSNMKKNEVLPFLKCWISERGLINNSILFSFLPQYVSVIYLYDQCNIIIQ